MTPNPHLILTVDYEIFGNGLGCVDACVLAPARRMMGIVEAFGAPLTFFVEAVEFAAMESESKTASQAEAVLDQMRDALRRGHEVQLHLHPQFAGAQWDGRKWQTTDNWRIGDLDSETCRQLIADGKAWLESRLKDISSAYKCLAFRAGGWCIQPSETVVQALLEQGFRIDSTVAPGFRNTGKWEWSDFRRVPARPYWKTDGDVCSNTGAGLWEVPIATGKIGKRHHYRAVKMARSSGEHGLAPGCRGDYSGPAGFMQKLSSQLGKAMRLGRVMLDFSTMPADVLIEISQQWINRFAGWQRPIPLVAIAHTKNFTDASAKNLAVYLAWAKDEGIHFSTYGKWLEDVGA